MSEEIEVPSKVVNEGQRSIYELFETDTTMEQQGIVVDFGDYGKFKIARAGASNIKYTDSFKTRYKPYQKLVRQNKMPESVAQKLLIEVYADAIILAWEGVYDRKLKPIPYTRANVVQVMTDLPDLFSQILTESQNADLYRKEFIEDAGKNS